MGTQLTNPVDAYAIAVQAGEIPAGKYHRLACARHIRDRQREGAPEFPYRFDLKTAERLWRFAEQLKHYKGEWAGQFVRLEPHQKFRFGSKVGWLHVETGLRRFRNSYEEIPRKNGKSIESAIITLYLTFFDGEGGAEGYCAATKREQAMIVFSDAKKLVASSGLKHRLQVLTSNISHERTASKLQPLSADYNSLDGLNPSVVNIDEMHAQKNRGLIDVMETGTGSRRQPFINKITTAGDDPVSPCGDEHDYATKILDGLIVDDTYFAFIAHADADDDWTLPETAAKANPNYGISVKPEDLAGKVTKALGISEAAATYKQKHLNWWVNSSSPCLSVDGWRKGQSRVELEAWMKELEGEPCYVGIDLASKLDLMALSAMFPPTKTRKKTRWLQYIWTPEETLLERSRRDRAPYPVWRDQGWLRTTLGKRIDQDVVRPVLKDLAKRYQIELIGYDPWHADKLIDAIAIEDGFGTELVVPVAQTFAGMSSACLQVQADIISSEIDACGCPVTAWSVSNVVAQRDGKDNLLFTKGKSRGRIDPVISGTIATALWLKDGAEEPAPQFQVMVFGGARR